MTLTEARRWGRLDRLWERFLALRPPPLDAERARDRAWRKRRKSLLDSRRALSEAIGEPRRLRMEHDAFDGIDAQYDGIDPVALATLLAFCFLSLAAVIGWAIAIT